MSTLKEKYLADSSDLSSGMEEWASAQIDAANERIRELEQDFASCCDKLANENDASLKLMASLTAEREVSDKLERALNLAIEYWKHRQQRYKNRHPAWVTEARAALTEVGRLRSRGSQP